LTPLNVLQANAQSSFTQNNTSYATTPGGGNNNMLNNMRATNSLLGTSTSIPHLSQTQEIIKNTNAAASSTLEEDYKQRLKEKFHDHAASRQGSIQQTISEGNNHSQGDLLRLKNNDISSFDRKPSRSSL